MFARGMLPLHFPSRNWSEDAVLGLWCQEQAVYSHISLVTGGVPTAVRRWDLLGVEVDVSGQSEGHIPNERTSLAAYGTLASHCQFPMLGQSLFRKSWPYMRGLDPKCGMRK